VKKDRRDNALPQHAAQSFLIRSKEAFAIAAQCRRYSHDDQDDATTRGDGARSASPCL